MRCLSWNNVRATFRYCRYPGLILVGCALTLPALAAIPPPPQFIAQAWVLIDHDSGTVLAEHRADRPLPPASLTKLMTAYLIFENLRAGQIKNSDAIPISHKAWRMKGSRVYIRPQQPATVDELIKSMIVRSANDATIALVERIAGSEERFVAQMNARAHAWGLKQTRFMNATGLDQEGHYASARDLSRIAAALIRDFPDYYLWFGLKEFTFNDAKQYNSNALLWRDSTADGVKTGMTRLAGYCLVASSRRDGMRLIATVLGAQNETARVGAAQRLLEYGFSNFETRLVYGPDRPATTARVWMGDRENLPLGLNQNLYLTLPRGWHTRLNPQLAIKESLFAPIHRGEKVGSLSLHLNERLLAEYPLVALEEVEVGHVLQRAIDRLRLWLSAT